MDKRKAEILKAIVNYYIDSPNPVGSRTISKECNFGISSATIRNEMADLEEMGYLKKPHTSAGRIPSDKAYRFFVNELSRSFSKGTSINNLNLKDVLLEDVYSFSDLFRKAAKVLSDTTNSTAYVISLRKPDTKIKLIHLIKIDLNSLLLLIVGNRGAVEKQIINVSYLISDLDLENISERLNERFSGVDISEITQVKLLLKGKMLEYEDFIYDLIKRITNFNKKMSELDFYYNGLTNILNFEEYYDINKIKQFIEFMESTDSVLSLIDGFEQNKDIDVIIGDENKEDLLKSNSFIRASFKPKNNQLGVIGIIGPVRMDYKKNIELVKNFRDNLILAIDEVVR